MPVMSNPVSFAGGTLAGKVEASRRGREKERGGSGVAKRRIKDVRDDPESITLIKFPMSFSFGGQIILTIP